jgi:hypothetical protein
VITARMRGDANAALAVPAGFTVETPPVRIPERSQIAWRVRALEPVAGELRITAGGASAVRTIDGRPGLRFLEPGWLSLANLSGMPTRSIEVEYPAASLSVFGLAFWWPIPFAAVFLLTMLAFRNRFGVTF